MLATVSTGLAARSAIWSVLGARQASSATRLLAAVPRVAATPVVPQPSIRAQIPRRNASSTAASGSGDAGGGGRGLRFSHLFMALAGGAILVTTYGILEWYTSLRVWPEAIRTPLRKALKARNHGDTEKAEGFFLEAIAAARGLPLSALEPGPLNKMSGLYITYAAMLEPIQPVRAFAALRDAYALYGETPLEPGATSSYTQQPMNETDRTRAIGLAQKMGQIAARMGSVTAPPPFPAPGALDVQDLPPDVEGAAAKALAARAAADAKPHSPSSARFEWDRAAEDYLGAAVGAMLKLGLQHRAPPAPAADAGKGGKAGQAEAAAPVVVGRDIRLPHDDDDGSGEGGRVNRRGLGMTMESLAEVYGRRGRPDLAGQLVLQAITTVLPPQAEPGSVTPADQCQAAMLMTTLSSYALAPNTPQAIKAARSWSLRALQEADAASKAAGWATGLPTDIAQATCQRAGSVALFNLGMLAEMEHDYKDAARHFNAALQAARDSGFGEGKREAAEALRRARGKQGAAASQDTK